MTTPNVPYRFELELTVPGTPEQVWQAIATAEGISGWMMPTELEPREGGRIRFEMGPEMDSVGKVRAYEPNRRVAYDEDWATLMGHPGADVTPLATEFLIEARSGGTCVVRVVTSAYGTGADWENEMFSELDVGWAPMLDNLRIYLTHFAGERAAPVHASATFDCSMTDAMDRVRTALGVASTGDRFTALGLDGVVERVAERHVQLRIAEPVDGLASVLSFQAEGGAGVQITGMLYGDDGAAAVELVTKQWQTWLDELAHDTAESASS